VAWAELACDTRVHAETHETPIARFKAGGLPRFPDEAVLTDAVRWAVTRKMSSTACVSIEGNRYQVDPALVGRRVECLFVPEDLTAISVFLEGR
jgi:putative transposase